MKIAVACQSPLRRWQIRLASALRDSGHVVILAISERRRAFPTGDIAVALQQRVFGPRSSLFDRVTSDEVSRSLRVADIQSPKVRSVDVAIVLDDVRIEADVRLEPVFAGSCGDAALLAMAASDTAPNFQLRKYKGAERSVLVMATLAIEDRDTLCRSLDRLLARIVSLILQGVRRLESGQSLSRASVPIAVPGAPLRHMIRGLVRKTLGRFAGRGQPHWRVGYRRIKGGYGVNAASGWPADSYSFIPDDGSRFYADPMPVSHAGGSCIFVEDYPYATHKGVIAVIEIGADGRSMPPRTVLERPCHLSYPFLIRHNDDIYMLPETSGAGCVQLFRADPFPDRWVPDCALLDGVIASDATIIVHAGRWWMFAALSDDGGSSWDQLGLFHATDLFGPWVAHADNPVFNDAGAARPAGPMWHEDGVLMRVAQDCRIGYGDGLAICRVDRLDDAGFEQTVVARLSAPYGTGAAGVHTLARDGDLEVIDLRFPSAAR